jgi:hypothetical protein
MSIKARLAKLESLIVIPDLQHRKSQCHCYFYGEDPTEEDMLDAEEFYGGNLDDYYKYLERVDQRKKEREEAKQTLPI